MSSQTLSEKLVHGLLRTHSLWAKLIPNIYLPYPVPGGRAYLNIKESRMMLARAVHQYEPERHLALKAFLCSGDSMIDIGSNKGDFALLGARLVGPQGRVLAFEPEPTNFHWLTKSIKLNHYANTTAYQIALGESDGPGSLYLGKKSGWHTVIPDHASMGNGIIPVTIHSLDSHLRESNWNRDIRMMKIDVEGAEESVLRGARDTIAASRDLIILLDLHPHLGADSIEVLRMLKNWGFSIYHETPPFDLPLQDHSGETQILAKKP